MSNLCKLVEDLLPLYHDGVCSDESRRLVEEHISQCERCRRLLEQIDGELVSPGATEADIRPLKSISKAVKKGKKKTLIAGIAATLAAMLILLTGVSIWWYSQEYTYFLAFAENQTPHSMVEYNEDGSILQSIVTDANLYTWYDDTYCYNVVVPSYLSKDGRAEMSRLDNTEDRGVFIRLGKWNDVAYAFHVGIVRDGELHYFIVDSELNQYYLDHWTDETIAKETADLAAHKEEVQALIADAKAMWPFLK